MNNQTVNNEENNRGGKTKKELEIALRSVWQPLVDELRTFYILKK